MFRSDTVPRQILRFVLATAMLLAGRGANGQTASTHFYIDCSQNVAGDGSQAHPWNTLAAAEAHPFIAGDLVALKRGTVCHGSFSPQGSGTDARSIRLTAYGQGPRPRIIASSTDLQALLLSNQQYWQIDSLDLSGANKYGIFVTGDNGTLHHIYLKNLFVHDVYGGAMKSKDNGLVIVGPSKLGAAFEDVLLDGVDTAHTNQWAGILVGGGSFYIAPDAFINKKVTIRNSTAQDVYGDGIVLFRDAQSSIETSVAWETGMQPTETIGTPNAIWTWTCTDCTVQDNEAFLTDSPGVDGGAYDIDWSNTRNVIQRNYGHDTQGYCFAVFAAGYVTSDSIVRENLCIDNGLSPRLAALQGAAYISTWDGGVLRGLRIEDNTIVFNPPVSSAAAVVNIATVDGAPILFNGNHIDSSTNFFYRSNASFAPSANHYQNTGASSEKFTLGDHKSVSLADLQAAGAEAGSTFQTSAPASLKATSLLLDATLDFVLDADGLLAPETRAQLVVLRSLSAQYGPQTLSVKVHLIRKSASPSQQVAQANALLDLGATSILFDDDAKNSGTISLLTADGHRIEEWHGFQNAATLGGAVRALLGAPIYARMSAKPTGEQNR